MRVVWNAMKDLTPSPFPKRKGCLLKNKGQCKFYTAPSFLLETRCLLKDVGTIKFLSAPPFLLGKGGRGG